MRSKKRLFVLSLLLTGCLFLLGESGLHAQVLNISGSVTDKNGDGIIGASVMVKGTLNGTVTDEFGSFTLSAPAKATLVVSCIGFTTVEMPADDQNMTIVLEEDSQMLEQVVVLAYGSVKAKDFTGAVSEVKVADSPIGSLGITDPTNYLRGAVPGLQIGQSGTVGQSGAMLVRGRKSIGSTTAEPMLIVDGMIYRGTLNDLDPSNIEDISVLKDASSLAAYGSQAAQGVIMVTTKKGKSGKPVISFSTTQTHSTPTYKSTYFDGPGYIRLRNARAGKYDSDDTSFMTALELKNYNRGTTTDWFDIATRTGHTQNYNLQVMGGSNTLNYSINLGRSYQQGIYIGNDFSRTNLSARISTNINQYVEAGVTMDFSQSDDSGLAAINSQSNTPYGSPYFDNSGKMRKYTDGMGATNPLWSTGNGAELDAKRTINRYNGYIQITAPWIEGLSYKITASYSNTSTRRRTFFHEEYTPAIASGNNEDGYTILDLSQAYGSESFGNSVDWVIDNILTYTRSFGRHYINSSLVYTRDSQLAEVSSHSGSGFTNLGNTLLGWYGLDQADVRSIAKANYVLHNDIGYLARIIYTFDDRYTVNASFRRDGSSVFGKDRKWGNFPAVGLSWNISNEKFFQPLRSTLDDLRLKVSWGKNGSQTLSPYSTLSKIALGRSTTAMLEGNAVGSSDVLFSQRVSEIGNSELGWQSTESINAGLEASAWGRRVRFEANYYFSKTTDQIFSRTIPIMGSGVNTQLATMGQVNNWGIEAILNTTNVKKGDFTWNSQLTFNLNRNKLVKLWGGENEEDDYTNERFIGKSLDVIWNYEWDGIVQELGKGSIPTRPAGYPNTIDKDGNGSLDRFDKEFLGNSRENFRLTFSNTLTWKGFQLYFMFTGTFGGANYALANDTFAYYVTTNSANSNSLSIPFWTPTNMSNTYPSAEYTYSNEDWFVYNSYAHVRLQDLSLSYNLTPLVKNFGISNARITLSGQNLFYIAPYWKGSDPEARRLNGHLLRTVSLGASLSF